MPPVSVAQRGAMQAAAHGTGKLGIPVDVAREFVGDGPPKKKVHARGRKKSTKPGAHHLSELQKAHAKGDHKAARMHALNYAKHSLSMGEPDADEMGGPPDMDADDMAPKASPKVPAPNPRAMLAKIAMGRAK